MVEYLLALLIVILIALLLEYMRVRRQLGTLRTEFSLRVEERARTLFDEWRDRELSLQRSVIEEGLRKELESRLREELLKREEEIRRDAVERSRSVIMGRVGEQLAPILIFEKYGINPKDARFLGTPVDYVVFKGLSDGEDKITEIVLVEVKTGKSASLNPREKQIKKLVAEKRISWLEINLTEELGKSRENSTASTHPREQGSQL